MERSRTISGAHDDNAPLITSPDTSYDNGDVAMQHIDSPRYSPTMLPSPEVTDRDYSTHRHSSSSTFDVEDGAQYQKHPHNVKHFDHHEARKTLTKNGLWRLLITLFFSAAMCITLRSWEGWESPEVLSKKDIRIFNSLTIGLSLCLGLNLLASLKHYASVFRWFFLSRRYVSLEVFDLILHFGSLAKVTKLMIISSPGFRGRKWLRKFSWFKDVRDDGTTWMWLVCVIWLFINIGSQVLIALLSLFWPLNNSEFPLLSPGTVTVANLNKWHASINETDVQGPDRPNNETSLEVAWSFGTEAMSYPEFDWLDVQKDLSNLTGTPIYHGDGAYHYRFYNREPTHPYINYVNSSRSVNATAKCDKLDVDYNGTIWEDEEIGGYYVEARASGTEEYLRYWVLESVPGSISWMASMQEFCGPRCTNFTVLQTQGDENNRVDKTSLFLCNNTLNAVSPPHGNDDIKTHGQADEDAVYGSDNFARIAAGSIAWTGITWYATMQQVRSYTQGNMWSPPKNMESEDIEKMLMRYTIGAVAAFDDHGIRYDLKDQTVVPFPGQQLDVDWSYIFSILGGICGIQFLALCVLVMYADRTIVRDDSYFSMAMLLRPVIEKIGKRGINMSGDEIKEHRGLQWKRIRYDYKEGEGEDPNEVTIFFEGKDPRESRKSWAAGSYS